MTNEAIIEAAARAALAYPADARKVMALAAQDIRAAALEEAAKIFDEDSRHLFDGQGIADTIRALKGAAMSDAIIEAAARALARVNGLDTMLQWDIFVPEARAVLTAVTPLIRAAVLEEAAKELEEFEVSWSGTAAAAIYALKERP